MGYRYWKTEDDATLMRRAKEGASVFDLAEELKRKPIDIVIRVRVLSGFENPNAKQRMPKEYYDQAKSFSQVAVNRLRKWSAADDDYLRKQFAKGQNIFELATYFNRTPTAITMRLAKLYEKPSDMTQLFNQAKLLLGKKRVVRHPAEQGPTKEDLTRERDALIARLVTLLTEIEDIDLQIKQFSSAMPPQKLGNVLIEQEDYQTSFQADEVIDHLRSALRLVEENEVGSSSMNEIEVYLLKIKRCLLQQVLNCRQKALD